MLFGLQVLVIFTSMVVVAFVTLLQNPVLGSPSWLPLLAFCWAAAFVVTMVLQASLPLPDIQRCGAAVAPLQFTCMQVSFAGMHRMNKPPCLGYTILSVHMSCGRFLTSQLTAYECMCERPLLTAWCVNV